MEAHSKQDHDNNLLFFRWKEALLHWLTWSLWVAVLFYGMHCYFEYRNQELDKRLEQLHSSLHDATN